MEIEDRIRAFLQENFLFREGAAGLDADTSLIESGIIDSAAVLTLVVFLEEAFDITVADEDVRPENLDSISKLRTYVAGKISDSPAKTT